METTEKPTVPENQFTIPLPHWLEFQEKINKLNKKAGKLGCEPIRIEHLGEHQVEMRHHWKVEGQERSRAYKVPAKVILLHGAAPKLEGFEFIARIEYLADHATMLFHTVPGIETKIDERFRGLGAGTCEHCKTQRWRKDCFVVREIATGVQTQVGRQCLADFTGINNPQMLAAKASWLHTFADLRGESERMWRDWSAQQIDTLWALQLTSAAIGKHGWTPKSASSETRASTASYVVEHFMGWPTDPEEQKALKAMAELAELPVHRDRARKAWEWVRGELKEKARSDYELNLVTLCCGELAEIKHLGIICSAIAAWQRATDQKIEYARKQQELAKSQHLDGTIGQRLRDIECTVQQVRALEAGQWGPKTLVKFLTVNGDLLTWFASGDKDFEVGEKVKITGTVKQFKEFRGVKETQLARVTIQEAAKA